MATRKLLLLVLAFAGVYLLGRGGVVPLVAGDQKVADHLLAPFQEGTAFDIGAGIVCMVLLTWVFLLGSEEQRITRTQLLRAMALGSATMAFLLTGVNLVVTNHLPSPTLPAVLAMMAFLHAAVGIAAAVLLAVRSESRRASPLPVLVNCFAVAGTGLVLGGPAFL